MLRHLTLTQSVYSFPYRHFVSDIQTLSITANKNAVVSPNSSIDHRPGFDLRHQGWHPARLGYYDNYLVDNHSCVIVGVETTAARMSQETVAAQGMIAHFAQWRGREPASIAVWASQQYS